ncbi:hypothetical protein N7457_000098 [Penicillium paradoxum]|uniref:uncharacterized protein n=1 Tax=Penicillium paradoxum TaxID=176176 RepID=UPI002548E8CB|nr:uncharacterized protein N7457_000098 [Penicillium paradoxum]KAJ5793499.1 hypothetical protein N7457_000098 [Penicillium paradoxum]
MARMARAGEQISGSLPPRNPIQPAPHMPKISTQLGITRRMAELGPMAIENRRDSERSSNNTTSIKYFFKDVGGIRKFPLEPLQKQT